MFGIFYEKKMHSKNLNKNKNFNALVLKCMFSIVKGKARATPRESLWLTY